MPDSYRFTGHAGESLASGRALVPSEEVPDTDLTRDDDGNVVPHDQAYIDEGKLLPIEPPAKRKRATTTEDDQ